MSKSQQVDPKDPEQFSGGEMSLTEHLGELRSRLIKIGISVIVGMVVSWYFIEPVIGGISRLATDAGYQLQALRPTELFGSYLRLAFMAGIGFSMPLIVYQIIAFISPGLTRRERGFILKAVPFVALMFCGGVYFAYRIVLPSGIEFLYGFGGPGTQNVEKNIGFAYHLSFVTNLLLWIGVSFETPVVVFSLIKTGIISAAKLASIRRYVFIVVLVAAAMITPTPDPLNMMLVAGPMYLLYELGIILGRVA